MAAFFLENKAPILYNGTSAKENGGCEAAGNT